MIRVGKIISNVYSLPHFGDLRKELRFRQPDSNLFFEKKKKFFSAIPLLGQKKILEPPSVSELRSIAQDSSKQNVQSQ